MDTMATANSVVQWRTMLQQLWTLEETNGSEGQTSRLEEKWVSAFIHIQSYGLHIKQAQVLQ